VTGIDLSEESIAFARQFEHDFLAFYKQDMRAPFRVNYYDYIFNLFTSFGFFDNDKDHLKAIKNAAKGLKPSGQFVIDYLNIEYVAAEMIAFEQKTIDGIAFNIRRSIENGYVLKKITFEVEGRSWAFEERVRAFSKTALMDLIEAAGLEVQHIFGDYALNPYNGAASNRLILVAILR
jgi:SAM-dependent methyltransferase